MRPPRADDQAKGKLVAMIASLQLPPNGAAYLTDRWLDQLTWFEVKAARNQTSHRRFRVVAIVSGVLLPALVNTAVRADGGWVDALAIALSAVAGLVAALDGFLRPGERWLQFRQTAEQLRSEFWMFSCLAGTYAEYPSAQAALRRFTERTEAIIADDVTGFVALAAPDGAVPDPPATSPSPGGAP